MYYKAALMAVLIAALVFISGCATPEVVEEPIEFERITDEEAIPVEIREWVEESREKFLGQTREHEDKLYLLVTYGEKPTGGYAVEITGVTKTENRVIVTASFTEPAEDEMVTQALTYPYDLVVIEEPGLPVEFVATGAEDSIPARD